MAVHIRLARGGSKKRAFYNIVAADSRSPRDGKFIEKLGVYNPLLGEKDEKRVTFDAERVKHWLSVGALPTEKVAKFLSDAGLVAKPKIAERPKKSAPKAKAVERAKAKAEKSGAGAASEG